MPFILRRQKLGRTSCKEIARNAVHEYTVTKNPEAIPEDEIVFRWGCTATIPNEVEVVNKAEAIHLVNNKTAFRKILQEHKLCPKTWFGNGDIKYPVIWRPSHHAQGKNLFVVEDEERLTELQHEFQDEGYASEIINKVAEYRVAIANGRSVWVARKIPASPEAIAWNVAQGGRFENVKWGEWPLRAVRVSIESFNLSGLDFGAVDIMVDARDRCYVLEINSAPSQTSPYRQQSFAKAFDWITENGREKLPLIDKIGDYKKFIHPAIFEGAL